MEIIDDERISMCNSEELVEHIGEEWLKADWFDIIYPEGDCDAVTVTKYDYSLLNPEEFISDNIIDFYIKHLQIQLPNDRKEKLYFFNSFFFRKLTESEKRGSEKSVFERVKRWTARVDIFEKDFLFIPIMQNAHWSLIIVRNLGSLSTDKNDQRDTNVSMIYHLDSIEGYHMDLEDPIRTYLVEAWKQKHDGQNGHPRNLNVKFLSAKVPQQTNLSDCGLFLLHYVEMFISNVWDQNTLDFMTGEWFNPEEASRKRLEIQSLIQFLQEKEAAKRGLASTVNPVPSSHFGCENSDVITNTNYADYDKRDIIQQSYFLHNQNYERAHYNSLLQEKINFLDFEYHNHVQQNSVNLHGDYEPLEFYAEKADQSLLQEEAADDLYRSPEYGSVGNALFYSTDVRKTPARSETVLNKWGGMSSMVAICVDYTNILDEDHHINNSEYRAVDSLTERNVADKIDRRPSKFSDLLEQCMHGDSMDSRQTDMVLMETDKILDVQVKSTESDPVLRNPFNNDVGGSRDTSHLYDMGSRSSRVNLSECDKDFGSDCQTLKNECKGIVVGTDLREPGKCCRMESTAESVKDEDEMPSTSRMRYRKRSKKYVLNYRRYRHALTWLQRLTRSGTKIKGDLFSGRRSYLLRRVSKK